MTAGTHKGKTAAQWEKDAERWRSLAFGARQDGTSDDERRYVRQADTADRNAEIARHA